MPFDFPALPATDDRFDTGTGIIYKWNGTVWLIDTSVTPLPNNQRVTNYNSAGTYSYVKPVGLKYLQVEMWGAGGGGGGSAATAATTVACGGGGGGGGYSRKLYRGDELSATETLVIGAGGAGGIGAAAAADGASSTFKGQTANGGLRGNSGNATAVVGSMTARGSGGLSSGGDINIPGGSGYVGVAFPNGLAAYALQGASGASPGREVNFPLAISATAPGSMGPVACGGSGAAAGFSQAAQTGGTGAFGQAIFTEYFWDPDYVATGPLISSMKRVVFTASGTYTKPAGLKFVDVELVGAGGTGAAAPAAAAGQSSAGGGGGGGGYCRKLYAAGDLAATEPYVIGVGSGTSGGAGTDSTFKALVASGGGGGVAVVSATTLAAANAGTGGAASGGDLNVTGSHGGNGVRAVHGSPIHAEKGEGGGTALSPSFIGNRLGTGTNYGLNGLFPGGGGQGGSTANGGGAGLAGIGSGGVIIFTEYY